MEWNRTLAAVAGTTLVACVACAEPPEQRSHTPATPIPAEEVLGGGEWLDRYPWLDERSGSSPLRSAIPAPTGFIRIELEPGSFGEWLRHLPTRVDRLQVLAHDGRALPGTAAAVVTLDVGPGDLQQCADSIIRLHAEHLWSRARADDAAYHFTSGDLSTWKDWVSGEVFRIDGARVRRLAGNPRTADHPNYRLWLHHLFRYAGTRSLALDSVPVPATRPLQPGDFLVDPGSPGHAVLVLDVAVHEDGRRVGLVGQGFIPAQEFHVVSGDGARALEGTWFSLPSSPDDALDIPSWSPFPRSSARSFSAGG